MCHIVSHDEKPGSMHVELSVVQYQARLRRLLHCAPATANSLHLSLALRLVYPSKLVNWHK